MVDGDDAQSIEVGVKFTASSNGYITGVEFYKAATNTGTHTGSLWSATGQLLATGTFTNETASGWQTMVSRRPSPMTAGQTYVASYHTNVGHYSLSRSYFTAPYSNGRSAYRPTVACTSMAMAASPRSLSWRQQLLGRPAL